jgi:hypothetical protein
MKPIRDALELLTAQHEVIDSLLVELYQQPDIRTLDTLADRLTAHLALEQQMFYPVVAVTIPREVMQEMLAEHVAIKQVLAELVWMGVDDESFRPCVGKLAELLLGHTGWQEEQLFQVVAGIMSPEALVALGDQLREHQIAFPIAIAA